MDLILKGIIIGLMISIPLGPIGVLIVQRTLNKGRLSGFVSGMGAASADSAFALLAGFGITFIFQFVEEQQLYFQIIGGVVIIFLGVNIFYSNPIKQLRMQRLNRNRLSQDFFSVFFLTLSNPMAIFFFMAMFTGVNLASGSLSILSLFSLVGGVTAGAALWWFLLSSSVNFFRHRFRLKTIWWMNKIAGVLIVLLGLAAILSIWFY
jgi:threonine/homoserine/homoserine lactone efflux protein